jgi:proteasome activator subunit 4
VVVGLLNLLLPTGPPPPDNPELQPAYYLPSEHFPLWNRI